ncbi:heme ABC exporter ATP-binding protein CcmA [Qingshengfaniella alkalisoli]|uniref:Heme ABC exporter ATP-binding protein CcmA n=1 Tax=Qingshengfaniella alkalisoli TaxID=2599296 RepID=A0A5B8J7B5_9RHOB|nr:heme ABC exporter ATP-binding protein CcmA [Qingshengfaniella alkalisoli]
MTVDALSCARGGRRVVEGLSFSIRAGDAVALRGPNGIGKTTVLRCIAGLQPVEAGQIALPDDAIAYAGHLDGLKATLTVSENLSFWASVFGGGKMSDALKVFDLKDLEDRPVNQLSAGQKRRLGLARLIVSGRPLWVLDEPTVSLDSAAVTRFADILKTHCAHGGAVLAATHLDMGFVMREIDLSAYRAQSQTQMRRSDEAFL